MSYVGEKLRMIRAGWAAKKAYDRAIKPEGYEMFNDARSSKRAVKDAAVTAKGAAVTGGPVAAGLAALRIWAPDVLPWGIDGDAAIVAVTATVLAPLWSWWRRRANDKKEFSGPGLPY